MKPGETVLVTAAAGGTGQIAVSKTIISQDHWVHI